MMDILSKIDKMIQKLSNFLMGSFVTLIIAIVFIQVVFRYVLKLPLAGAEELPKYFMIACVYLAAGLLARDDGHVKIDMLTLIVKNEKIIHIIRTLTHLLSCIAVLVFTILSFEYVSFNYTSKDVSAGLGFPMWCITSFLIIGGTLMTINYFISVIKDIKEVKQWQ